MYRFNKICVFPKFSWSALQILVENSLSWRQIRFRQIYFLWAKAVFGFESGSEIIAKAGSGSEKNSFGSTTLVILC